jgi:HTH-type transcriptional regulator/antitoxin HipB
MSTQRVVRSPAAIGRAIKARRETLSLTQEQLAQRSLTNRYAVLKLEDGAATKQLQTLFDVLFALGLELTVQPKGDGTGR